MKYIKLFESMTEVEVEKICRKFNIKDWTLRPDGLVDVEGSVLMWHLQLEKIPLRFGVVGGHFDCSWNNLETLEGAPQIVHGRFYCHENEITSLEGAPIEVDGDFICENNKLTNLEGGPKEVRGGYHCSANQLTSLKGVPKEVNAFSCYNNKLTSLADAPEHVDGLVHFFPNYHLPVKFMQFLRLNSDRYDLQKYIFTWQKDYAIWRRNGSFNEANFIQMMESAKDELENIMLI